MRSQERAKGERDAQSGQHMVASLDCSGGGDSLFSVVESNHFRELTHIALRLRPGTDEASEFLALSSWLSTFGSRLSVLGS